MPPPEIPIQPLADAPVPTPDGKLRLLPAGGIPSRIRRDLAPAHLARFGPGARLDEIERLAGAEAGLRYLAWALPEREAVWWACMCALCAPHRNEAEERVIAAARAWVRRPDETARAAMLGLAREAGATGPAGHAGRAAFMSRIDDPASLRAGFSVSGAFETAAAALPAEHRRDAAARFRASALDISTGGAGWIDWARRD